jgi:DNA modification methylase
MADYLVGEASSVLATLEDGRFQCCVTSPPYWGLRDYGAREQLGIEPTPEEYVTRLVSILRGVRRVLRSDGSLWLNLGSTYIGGRNGGVGANSMFHKRGNGGRNHQAARDAWKVRAEHGTHRRAPGWKAKDLVLIPAMVAIAARADGWWLRSECIWVKSSPMPEPAVDRPGRAHEQVFLLTKSARYFYDRRAVGRALAPSTVRDHRKTGVVGQGYADLTTAWPLPPTPYRGAHFATMPVGLAEICIRASSRIGDEVLDPFGGAGTTALAATRLGRRSTLIDINPAYESLARDRLRGLQGTLAQAEAVAGIGEVDDVVA